MAQLRKLAAIMFTDIVGYTTLMGKDENLALSLLRKNKEIHQKWLKKCNGQWLKEMGDGVLASFNTVIDAVHCAGALQKEVSSISGLELRIGIHLGDIVVDGKEIYGDGVNIASRIQGIAESGEVVVSEAVYQNIKNKPGFVAQSKGSHSVKNVPFPISIYSVEYSPSLSYEGLISRPTYNKSLIKIIVSTFVLGLAGYLFYLKFSSVSTTQDRAPKNQTIRSLVVLPFDNLTGDSTQNNLIFGLHDNLITALSQIDSLQVISRTSSLAYMDRRSKTITEIASELDVDAIVETTVLKSFDSIRINVQFVQAFPEKHLWAKIFDRPYKDILYLFDDVSLNIAKEVNAKLVKASSYADTKLREINPTAYKAYLTGNFYLNNLPTAPNINTALSYFERSIRLDSAFAPAYAGIASVWIYRWQLRISPGVEAVPKIYSYNQKALEIDENYPHSQYIKALMSGQSEWDWAKSEDAFKAAIEANPNHALTHAQYGHLLMNLQRIDEAIFQMEEALRLDPFSPLVLGLYGVVLTSIGELEKASEIINRDSLTWGKQILEERIVYSTGDYKESINLLEGIFGRDTVMFKKVQEQFSKNGYQAAMAVLARSLESYPLFSAVATSVFYNRAGMIDDSIRLLEQGYAEHDPDMPYAFVPIELKNLELYPRYQKLAKKMNLPV